MEICTENDGWIRTVRPVMTPPSLKDNRADVDRLVKGIKKVLQTKDVKINFQIINRIPTILRECGYDALCVLYKGDNSWHLVDLFPSQQENTLYGLAVDLGSSTVVVRLLNLITREIKDEISFLNPQIEIGYHFRYDP